MLVKHGFTRACVLAMTEVEMQSYLQILSPNRGRNSKTTTYKSKRKSKR